MHAAITGLGITCALGTHQAAVLRALRDSRSGIATQTVFVGPQFASSFAGCAPLAFDASTRRSRADKLALIAASEALDDARLDEAGRATTGVVFGSGSAGLAQTERALRVRREHGLQAVRPSMLVAHQGASTTDLLAARFGLGGPRATLMTACSSGAMALGVALDWIRLGRCRRVLAGSSDGLCGLTFAGFSALRVMSATPCRPFDAQRTGLTLGEGAAFVVLDAEPASGVRARLRGYGVSVDAYHLTAPSPDGQGAARAMQLALADAQIEPTRVGYVNAHGTATLHNDSAECQALRQVFGRVPPTSSTKAHTGHALSAAGAIEAVICVLALEHELLPPTLGLRTPDPAATGIELITERARSARTQVALSSSFAFGGHNVCLVLERA